MAVPPPTGGQSARVTSGYGASCHDQPVYLGMSSLELSFSYVSVGSRRWGWGRAQKCLRLDQCGVTGLFHWPDSSGPAGLGEVAFSSDISSCLCCVPASGADESFQALLVCRRDSPGPVFAQ